MSKTWQTEEMAVNRLNTAEATQTMILTSISMQMKSRGILARPDVRSESASEVRNMLVSVLNIFFLHIKKIMRPFSETINRHMKDIKIISGEVRSLDSFSGSVPLVEVFPTKLELNSLGDEETLDMLVKKPRNPVMIQFLFLSARRVNQSLQGFNLNKVNFFLDSVCCPPII